MCNRRTHYRNNKTYLTYDNVITPYNLFQLMLKSDIIIAGTSKKNEPEFPLSITIKDVLLSYHFVKLAVGRFYGYFKDTLNPFKTV